jgi:hypothetical protein
LLYCLREAWDHVVEKAGVLSLVVKREYWGGMDDIESLFG